jgi:ectoine hydroxylase-related dioxygenase (phytanoyl-CoA dioxygenase family)
MSVHDDLERDGYTVLRGLVPEALCARVRERIWRFVDAHEHDEPSWYRHPPEAWFVVPLHHDEALWQVRQHPPVHAAFARILGTERLWVSMDRAGFQPPHRDEHSAHRQTAPLHWDSDPSRAQPDGVELQAVLYLDDTPAEQGAFQCVPAIYRDLARELARRPPVPTDDGWPVDPGLHPIVSVPGRTGDLVVWKRQLPHRGGPNHGTRPRLAQYLTFHPEGGEAARTDRIELFRSRRAPSVWRDWPTQLDPEPGAPASLTALGRKLVGFDRW